MRAGLLLPQTRRTLELTYHSTVPIPDSGVIRGILGRAESAKKQYCRWMVGLDSPWHWLALVAVLLLLFGSKKLPEIGRSLGKGMREFKDTVSGLSLDADEKTQSAPKPSPPAREDVAARDQDATSP